MHWTMASPVFVYCFRFPLRLMDGKYAKSGRGFISFTICDAGQRGMGMGTKMDLAAAAVIIHPRGELRHWWSSLSFSLCWLVFKMQFAADAPKYEP